MVFPRISIFPTDSVKRFQKELLTFGKMGSVGFGTTHSQNVHFVKTSSWLFSLFSFFLQFPQYELKDKDPLHAKFDLQGQAVTPPHHHPCHESFVLLFWRGWQFQKVQSIHSSPRPIFTSEVYRPNPEHLRGRISSEMPNEHFISIIFSNWRLDCFTRQHYPQDRLANSCISGLCRDQVSKLQLYQHLKSRCKRNCQLMSKQKTKMQSIGSV